VPWGRSAKHVVVLAESGGKIMVARVAGGAAKAEPDTNLALEPRDTLTWSNAAVAAAGLLVPAAVLDRAPDAAVLTRVPVTAVFARVLAVGAPVAGGPAPSSPAGGPASSTARAALWSSSARAAR